MKIISLFKRHRYGWMMTLSILLILWPFTFFVFTPKWDNLDAFLPYRYFISDFLWNGQFPYWNSFQLMGYPSYADTQSGMWNPITWFIMLFGKYTVKSVTVELLSYFLIAAWGMYWLTDIFIQNKKIAALIGLCYALSGPMVGTAQIMVFVAGVAWLPWCLGALYLFLTRLQMKYVLLAGLFVALEAVSASPAYTIVLAYLFFFSFILYIFRYRKQGDSLRKIFLGGMALLFIVLVLMLPYLYSEIEFAPYFSRLEKLPYEKLIINPFAFIDYISFLFPYSVISHSSWFDITDLSMRNGYFGIFSVFFVFVACKRLMRTERKIVWLVGIAVVFLTIALGDGSFIFPYLHYLPGFGVFRHPAFFRTYAILALLLVAAFGIKEWIKSPKLVGLEKWVLRIFISLLVVLTIYCSFHLYGKDIWSIFLDLLKRVEFSQNSLEAHLLVNSMVVFACLLLLYVLIKRKKYASLSILWFVFILDLGVQTNLSGPTTLYYPISFNELSKFFHDIPNNIQQKDLNVPMRHFDEKQPLLKTPGIWYNISTYNKTISYAGSNPTKIKYFVQATDDSTLYFNLENPLFFFANRLKQPNDTIQQGLYWGEPFNKLHVSAARTSIQHPSVGYNSFTAMVENNSDSVKWLLLNQNYYPKWKATFNGKVVPISRVNTNIMGVTIPAYSEGKIIFQMKSNLLPYFWLVSILSYFAVGLVLVRLYWKRSE